MCKVRLLFLIILSLLPFSARATNSALINYCVPTAKIDFNPYRHLLDGKDMGFLLFTRSLISSDPKEIGVLSAYEFSPDGSVFTGVLSRGLNWYNGDRVKPFEVAVSIARQLPFRTLGEKVKIAGPNKASSEFASAKYPGIEILGDSKFSIKFESSISNLTGVLREAFTTNSRHNRFWISRQENPAQEVLTKFPLHFEQNVPVMMIKNQKIRFTTGSDCAKSDATMFGDNLDRSAFNASKAKNPSATSAVFNTNTLNLMERKATAAFIRGAFKSHGGLAYFDFAQSFFEDGENGFSNVNWPASSIPLALRKKIRIGYEMPAYKPIIEKALGPEKAVELIPLPSSRNDLDVQIIGSTISEGRQIILQDVLKWTNVESILKNAPKTTAVLKVIASKSSATIPVDKITLKNFETAALEEISLVPIARRRLRVFTRNEAPICLVWSAMGELSFSDHPCEKNTP